MTLALYARVSMDKQGREQTMESQLEALRTYAAEKGYQVDDRYIYIEEFPGDQLDRPKLEALRNDARDGEFDAVLVHCPDRLTRRCAYQEIIIEELKRYGCQVVFVHGPTDGEQKSPPSRQLQAMRGAEAACL